MIASAPFNAASSPAPVTMSTPAGAGDLDWLVPGGPNRVRYMSTDESCPAGDCHPHLSNFSFAAILT